MIIMAGDEIDRGEIPDQPGIDTREINLVLWYHILFQVDRPANVNDRQVDQDHEWDVAHNAGLR